MRLDPATGLVDTASYLASPNCDDREDAAVPEVIIIHCISLPPGQYGGPEVSDFFLNQLPEQAHPYFKEIGGLTVSAHFFIRRDGELLQFVPTHKRAWHAGESVCLGRPKVNNFSIGIELEGLDTDPDGFTDQQYNILTELLGCLRYRYPDIKQNNIFAHSDVAPGRKADPGCYFQWSQVV